MWKVFAWLGETYVLEPTLLNYLQLPFSDKFSAGQIENSETSQMSEISDDFFRLFLFRLFDFGLILQIKNSEEENSESKFWRFRRFHVFDLPLFNLTFSSDRLSFFHAFFFFCSYFVWICYFKLLDCDYPIFK